MSDCGNRNKLANSCRAHCVRLAKPGPACCSGRLSGDQGHFARPFPAVDWRPRASARAVNPGASHEPHRHPHRRWPLALRHPARHTRAGAHDPHVHRLVRRRYRRLRTRRPCRTLTYAYGQTSAGGEINILDAAGFGTLNITGSISIIGNGTAGILVPSGGIGITINAGASDAVNLRGLIIGGAGVGGIGIQFLSGKSLVVENCVARNLAFSGLVFIPSPVSLTALSVSNSYFLDNAANGILVQTGGSGPDGQHGNPRQRLEAVGADR
jgi:hypothetical protein